MVNTANKNWMFRNIQQQMMRQDQIRPSTMPYQQPGAFGGSFLVRIIAICSNFITFCEKKKSRNYFSLMLFASLLIKFYQ